MPTYTFKCGSCKTNFDVFCKISERDIQNCPTCGHDFYQQVLSTPTPMGDPVRLGIRSMDGGFREVLSRIRDANPKSNLGTKLSR